ncbi:DUF4126 family protein [Hymenobacter glaciei]|uniref:DUF4126 family protein n=1 Tax=Hymenobacter glaciei TaxID=877209 RepID=A0ABP7UNJ6_9BACT
MKKLKSKPRPQNRPAKFWPAIGFATLAGMRSMSAPAYLSHYLSRNPSWLLLNSPLRALQKPLVATGFKLAAAGEMVMDKLPGTPDRIAPPVLLGRLLSGALVGAAVYKSRAGSSATGAVVGGLGAVVATFISYALRVGISKQANWPVAAVGVGEDALVLSSGTALLRAQPGR